MVLPAINLLAITLALLSIPRNMPPLAADNDAADREKQHIISTSDYGARKNHPTSYDNSPSFKGPLQLTQKQSPDFYRKRIRGYYLDNEKLCNTLQEQLPTTLTLGPSTPTGSILKSIVDHLARSDAPVDVKEVAESTEFYLRSGKRLIGAARRVLQNNAAKGKNSKNGSSSTSKIKNTITIQDICSGHGLTGLLFLACNPPGRFSDTRMRAVLVDQFEPKSHAILRDCISEICPWVAESVSFDSSGLENFASQQRKDGDDSCDDSDSMNVQNNDATIIISTHACGSLTDKVLEYAMDVESASVAVMPCCYTGTDSGVPYGVRRMLGVGLSADVRRSFILQDRGYLVDFAAVPRAITPMNRIVVAERRK